MNKDFELISGALIELRDACKSVQSDLSECNFRILTRKYGITFLGGRANAIYSDELFSALKGHWGYDISPTVFNSILPEACALLGMSCKKIIALEDIKTDPQKCTFSIRLID